MRHVSKEAQKTIDKLTAGLSLEGDKYRRYINPGWMPLIVEFIGTDELSISHRITAEGHVLADPMMTFWRCRTDNVVAAAGKWFPVLIQQLIGEPRRALRFDDAGHLTGFNARNCRDLASFTHDWMLNVEAQHFHGVDLDHAICDDGEHLDVQQSANRWGIYSRRAEGFVGALVASQDEARKALALRSGRIATVPA